MAVLQHISTILEWPQADEWQPALLRAAAVILCLTVVRHIGTVVYNLYFHPLRHVPGPKLWVAVPLLNVINKIRGTADYRIRELHEEYGDVVRLAANELSFISPEAWKDIYGHGHADFPKYYPPGVHLDPRQIIASNARDHFRYRRAMLPAFSEKALGQQEPLITVYVNLLIQRLREVSETGQPIDMVRWYNLTTFDLIADLAYGESLNGLTEGKSNAWLENIHKIMTHGPIFILIGSSALFGYIVKLLFGSKMKKSKEEHMERVKALCEGRIYHRKQPDRGDFMDHMMRSRGQPHEMTDDELVVNSDLIMVAGSETTATLLTGTTYYLLKNPKVLAKLTAEVRNAFRSEDEINFVEARARLPYMMACLEEGLRLFPPVPLALARYIPDGAPAQICGLTVPPKTVVGVHHLSAYTSSINFHRAQEFIPERWLPENIKDPSSPFYNDRRDVHRPFSFGPRDCIGRNLAYHEMRLILAKILFNFDLGLDPSCEDWINQRIIALWEKPPLQVHIKPRSD
ncbi:hypothetical protein ACO1O0_003567 [Amphichorda felina]